MALFRLKLNMVIAIILIWHRSDCQRRIVHPNKTIAEKRYMVYLVKAEQSPRYYDNWICGGAIVSSSFILTSAACVQDVTFMYAIAGYNQYIKSTTKRFNTDKCIEKSKKRIIFSCLPKNYNFSYDRIDRWAYIDIAAVKVESPYDFTQPISKGCSWIPNFIPISYDYKHSEPGVDAMVMGWGSDSVWRRKNDSKDYNQMLLQYSPVLIQRKEDCKRYYRNLPQLLDIIDRYMICTMGNGNIDETGHMIKKTGPSMDGCSESNGNTCMDGVPYASLRGVLHQERRSLGNSTNETNSEFSTYGFHIPQTRRNEANELVYKNKTDNNTNSLFNSETLLDPIFMGPTRRNGICQNDHGGPLVTWVGKKEVVIGTASLFMVRHGKCIGPYLFTSTQCNGAFLSCVLTQEQVETISSEENEFFRRNIPSWFNFDICSLSPEEKGFDIIKRRIPWPDLAQLPNGQEPAEERKLPSEDLLERPQIPMNAFN